MTIVTPWRAATSHGPAGGGEQAGLVISASQRLARDIAPLLPRGPPTAGSSRPPVFNSWRRSRRELPVPHLVQDRPQLLDRVLTAASPALVRNRLPWHTRLILKLKRRRSASEAWQISFQRVLLEAAQHLGDLGEAGHNHRYDAQLAPKVA